MEDYTELYIRAARGLKEGDPDAVIGGPSTAFINLTSAAVMHSFLEKVLEENVPLDFSVIIAMDVIPISIFPGPDRQGKFWPNM